LAQRPIYGSNQPLSYIAATCGFVDQSHDTRLQAEDWQLASRLAAQRSATGLRGSFVDFRPRSPFGSDIDAVWVLLECTKWKDEVERPSIQGNRDHGS